MSDDLYAASLRLSNLLTRRLTPLFASAGITPQQWLILETISRGDGLPLVFLARTLRVSKQNMTGMINRLQSLDLIDRVGDPADLRSSPVVLSRRGRVLLDRIRPAYEEWTTQLMPKRELQTAMKAVETLAMAIERMPE